MRIHTLENSAEIRQYDDWILTHPRGNLWQSLERKKYIEACGKQTRIYVAEESNRIVASALIVIDRTTGGFSTWDIPRGPLWKRESGKPESVKAETENSLKALMEKILDDAKKDRCLALYLSPTESLSTSALPHFRTSPRRIHAEATRIIDLTQSDDQLLADMHQKGRYNINVAKKHGITVSQGTANDIDAFYTLLESTGSRDGFTISQKSHYTRFLTSLRGSFLLLAKHEGKAIAGLIGVIWPPPLTPPGLSRSFGPLSPADAGERNRNAPFSVEGNSYRTGIYYYGASSYEHRHLMAPYLLQWEAMQYCKQASCIRYDLLGISPAGAAYDDPWSGITEFKSKFGGSVIAYPKEQMIMLRPMVKSMLEWKRRVIG